MLLAGKYLNVIRECGIEIGKGSSVPGDKQLDIEDERHVPCKFPPRDTTNNDCNLPGYTK